MAECPVVPFFGAFLRELGEIITAGEGAGDHQPHPPHQPLGKPPKSGGSGSQTSKGIGYRDQQQQQRQVVGESEFELH